MSSKQNPLIFSLMAEVLCKADSYAIYGTGVRTSELMSYIIDKELSLPSTFLDDKPRKDQFYGIPVLTPQDAKGQKFKYIMLATDSFQEAMKRQVFMTFGSYQKTLTVYESCSPATKTVEKNFIS